MTTTTPNMNLVLPDVSITAGPQWATLLNAAYALIDSHDHSTGNGVAITPSGLNISSDLTFAQNNATNLRTLRLYPYGAFTPTGSDRTCLYALNGELYYLDASGNNVQITLNGAVDVSGAITSLSLKDTSFFIQYFGDTTRQFRFNASAIPASTTRVLSIPDSGANDTFVTQGASQVLTNKTLTAPIISSINTGSVTFTLPAADGSNTYSLQTNGSGVLSFAAQAASTPATTTTAGTITREGIWTSYSPTAGAGFGTVSNNSAFYKVLGDSLFVRGSLTTGSPAGSLISITIPGGFTISSAKLSLNNTSANPGNNVGSYGMDGTAPGQGFVLTAPSTSTSTVYFSTDLAVGNRPNTPQTGSAVLAATSVFTYEFEVPLT